MRNNWPFFVDPDGGSACILPVESFITNGFVSQLFSQIHIPGNLAMEAFSCVSKFAGALVVWFSSSNLTREMSSNRRALSSESYNSPTKAKKIGSRQQNFTGFHFNTVLKALPASFEKISRLTFWNLFNEAERLHSCSVLSLAAALLPPFDNMSSNVFALPVENPGVQIHESIDQRPCEVGREKCGGLSSSDLSWTKHSVEPRTGIEFPPILNNILDRRNISTVASELLVGTGSRTMKIVRIKSLEVYAFGFYVHPSSVCKKLGAKYASIPAWQLDRQDDLYQDLLREDIGMSVRLVVNYSGLKINSVKDAFEKSLRARLVKMNPDTDYHCLRAFGSLFTQDIPIPAGTVIDFRRTADGQLITEIGGNQIGAVRSKDLYRAFFDMYIGDLPVSEQTKQEIGKNVAGLIKRCLKF